MEDIYFEERPVEIADGIYWVGYVDDKRGLHCNPYLIVEGDEAVMIDGGNRDDFSNVMLKILQIGIKPLQIKRLIFHHYDPDLCGSLPQFENIINSEELKIISQEENNTFIKYYSDKTEMLDYRNMGNYFEFATGRKLEFYGTPYCHQPGSFITYDTKTKTLFSSDLFGSYDERWNLFVKLSEECRNCTDVNKCVKGLEKCQLSGVIRFHQNTMTSNKALSKTLDVIEEIDIERIAPQHGSILETKEDVKAMICHIRAIENIGIDFLFAEEKNE